MSVQYFPFLLLAAFQKIVPNFRKGRKLLLRRALELNINIVVTGSIFFLFLSLFFKILYVQHISLTLHLVIYQ